MKITKDYPGLTRAEKGYYILNGDLISEEGIDIELDASLVVTGSIEAKYGITAGLGIKAGCVIIAGWDIQAGWGIKAGYSIKAGGGIKAGLGIAAGWDIKAELCTPNAVEESSLSQILEANAPQKYYLSETACRGILRRCANRGKVLPAILLSALLYQGNVTAAEATEMGISLQPLQETTITE